MAAEEIEGLVAERRGAYLTNWEPSFTRADGDRRSRDRLRRPPDVIRFVAAGTDHRHQYRPVHRFDLDRPDR
jgi:hypothetical protein